MGEEQGKPAWQEEIPRVAEGNAFESTDLYFCKAAAWFDFESEEQYRRAQRLVAQYPRSFRILRYEKHQWKPALYGFYNVQGVEAYLYGDCEDFPHNWVESGQSRILKEPENDRTNR